MKEKCHLTKTLRNVLFRRAQMSITRASLLSKYDFKVHFTVTRKKLYL